MARRASSKVSVGKYLLALIALAVIAALVFFLLLGRKGGEFSGMRLLKVDEFRQSSRSLAGATYLIRGRMLERLRWEPGEGALWSIQAEDEDGNSAGILPVFLPGEFDSLNVMVGQDLNIEAQVDRKGLPIAKRIKKM